MTIKRLYNADVLYCFAGLKNLNFTQGSIAKGEIEFYLELVPSRMQVYIVPVHEMDSFAEDLVPFQALGYVANDIYVLSDTKDLGRKTDGIYLIIAGVECQRLALEKFKNQLSCLVASGQLSAADAQKLQDFIDRQILLLIIQIASLTDKRYFWVMSYNNSTMVLEAFQAGAQISDRKQVILSLPICFIKMINYTDFIFNEPNSFKAYSTLPKMEGGKMTIATLVFDKLRLIISELGTPQGEIPFIKRTTKYKKALSFTPACSQMDFEFYITYYAVVNGVLTELQDKVTQNGRAIFDIDLGLPGINPKAFNAGEPDNKPDKDSRVGLGVYFKDDRGYVGTVSYRTRFYTNQEMQEPDDKKRIISYLNSLVSDYQKGRGRIFTNLPNGPKDQESALYRHDVKVFNESPLDADPVLRRIDDQILGIESILEKNMGIIMKKIKDHSDSLSTQPKLQFPQNI